MDPFEYNANSWRVVFGPGSSQKLHDELRRLGLKSPLLLSTLRQVHQAEDLAKILSTGSIAPAGIYTNASMHTPSHITEEAMSFLDSKSADCVVSIGGGFTTGLDPEILPSIVIYDVNLAITLPPVLSATSSVNALAHAVEALYAKNKNPIISLPAIEGTKALAGALPETISDPYSRPAREKAQYRAWLCGICLGSSAMALHHKLCHTLGGSFNLPHTETHTIVLSHALSYNAPAIPDIMVKLAEALLSSEGDATKGLNVLLEKLKVKRALKDLGMKEKDIDKAVEIVVSNQYPNPRALEKEKIREAIRRC